FERALHAPPRESARSENHEGTDEQGTAVLRTRGLLHAAPPLPRLGGRGESTFNFLTERGLHETPGGVSARGQVVPERPVQRVQDGEGCRTTRVLTHGHHTRQLLR